MPEDKSLYLKTIMNINDLNTLQITDEDRKRGKMYKWEQQRKELENSVSSIDEFGMFMEIFEGFRNDIYAITAAPNADGTYAFYDTEISSAVHEIDFSNANITYENGDFQVSSNFGVVPAIANVGADILITDENCETLYGYAGYFFTPNETFYDSELKYYLDGNGDLVYL